MCPEILSKNIGSLPWHTSIHAERLHSVGTLLTKPASWWLERSVRALVLEFRPGHYGQFEGNLTEIMVRIAWTVVLAVALPLALLSVVLGAPMRAVASCWKREFAYLEAPPPLEKRDTPQKINVLTFNTMLGPEFMVKRNGLASSKERAPKVTQAILEQMPDIVCLQEAFHSERVEKDVAPQLQQAGYSVIYKVGHSSGKLNSGLVIASQSKLENIQFFPYSALRGFDKFSKKGLLLATTIIKQQTYVIANTHFNATYEGNAATLHEYRAIRVLQSREMQCHITQYIEKLEQAIGGVILCGDANVAPMQRVLGSLQYNPEWFLASNLENRSVPVPTTDIEQQMTVIQHQITNKQLELTDGGPFGPDYLHDIKEGVEAHNGSLLDLSLVNPNKPEEDHRVAFLRIDFVMVRKKAKNIAQPELEKVTILPMKMGNQLISDHRGVLATIIPSLKKLN